MAATGLAAEAFLLGISSGPVCLASCSPVLLPVLAAERQPARGTGIVLGKFLAGRLAGYLVFACLAWLLGLSLQFRPPARALLFGLSNLGIAVLLTAYAISLRRGAAGYAPACPAARVRSVAHQFGSFAPVCLGFATGLSLCPPFVTAGIRVAENASLPKALLFFAWFFVGTSAWFAPSIGLAPLRRFAAIGTVARLSLFLLAGYYGYLALIMLVGAFTHA